MDSITQATLGALVGECVLGRKLGWKAAAWGALLGTVPDLDILLFPLLDEIQELKFHRGISHSLLVTIFAPFLLAKPLAHLWRNAGVERREAWWLVLWIWSSHVLIDCFTTYGTQIWEPFSDARVSLNNMAIIDLFFTTPLLLGVVAALFFPREGKVRLWIGRGAMGLAGLYTLFSFGMKGWATTRFSDALTDRVARDGIQGELVAVAPTMSNVFLWRGLVEREEEYLVAYWTPFDRGEPMVWDEVRKSRDLAGEFAEERWMEALDWFSRGHWVARAIPGEGSKSVQVIDVRYAELGDVAKGRKVPIFHWRLDRAASGECKASSLRRGDIDMKEAFRLLKERIGGNREEWESLKSY